MPRRYNSTLTPAQRATLDMAIATFVHNGCFPVDVFIKLNEVGIDPYKLIDDLSDHHNNNTIQ